MMVTKNPADLAYQSLIFEVELTPKPGLVDLANTGSHDDMDAETFRASAAALKPYFESYYALGASTAKEQLFNALRQEGLLAEQAMFTATRGVNTHKGANFTFALFLGAIGCLDTHTKTWSMSDLFTLVKYLSKDILSDFEKEDYLHTHGGELYVTNHQLGVRGEAYLGYPTLQKLFTELLTSPETPYFWHRKLIEIMVTTEDSNLYHRGGVVGVAFAKEKGLQALETSENADFHDHLVELDEAFITRHLSPGGSADLLAMLYFLDSINK